MASLERDPDSGCYRLRFRYGGVQFKRSLDTTSRSEARTRLVRFRETEQLVAQGRIEIPIDVDPAEFLLSDGRLSRPTTPAVVMTLGKLFDHYEGSIPDGAKEASTRKTERIHVGHFRRHLPLRQVAATVNADVLQRYVNKRLTHNGKAGQLRPETIKKELATFRFIWNWAAERGYVSGRSPIRGVLLPKPDEKPPFMTWQEIDRIIRRGGITEAEEWELWSSLFLTRDQTQEFLDYVEQNARHACIHPLLYIAAHTGARLSEILRARIDDFDLDVSRLRIREKKKSKRKGVTYRYVPMSSLLRAIITKWFRNHPGGQFAIATQAGEALTPEMARHHFHQTLTGNKWKRLKGFHAFRHSFASNLAAGGVDQRNVDEWMGHQTDEMRRRYRHLFPEQQQAALESVFGAAADNGLTRPP